MAWKCACKNTPYPLRLQAEYAKLELSPSGEGETTMELKFDEKGLIPAIVQDHLQSF